MGIDPAIGGMWEPIRYRFSHLPIHMALLPTGKVLAFAGSGNDEQRLADPYPAELWDPETGVSREIDQPLQGDLFCAGQAFLPDGRLLVAGGTHRYNRHLVGPLGIPFRGLDQTYTFDPWTERWTRVENMRHGRWYPTLVGLHDGRVLAAAGFSKHLPWAFQRSVELYSADKAWQRLKRADRWLPLYPRMHLVPGGLFYSGSYNTHYTFPFALWGFPTALFNLNAFRWRRIGLPRRSEREEGASVLLPLAPPEYRARVLLVGGGTPGGKEATADAELIDLADPQPRWRQLPEGMMHPRYWLYPVLLPDGTVLVIGGRGGGTQHDMTMSHGGMNGEVPHDHRAVLEPELFHPTTETWQTMAPMTVDRLYHSNALLLPDGRVMVAGSNPSRRVNELRIEIYQPPYLFKEDRPSIEDLPPEIGYGETFEIETSESESPLDVVLLRPSATTHCLATEQRSVSLTSRESSPRKIAADAPSDSMVAPPGYYMLFLIRAGIPSQARFVRLA
jgi:hypothetical protein